MIDLISLCDFRRPPAERECLEMIWSEGRACKRCPVECYRQGWSQHQVSLDNAARVKRKLRQEG